MYVSWPQLNCRCVASISRQVCLHGQRRRKVTTASLPPFAASSNRNAGERDTRRALQNAAAMANQVDSTGREQEEGESRKLKTPLNMLENRCSSGRGISDAKAVDGAVNSRSISEKASLSAQPDISMHQGLPPGEQDGLGLPVEGVDIGHDPPGMPFRLDASFVETEGRRQKPPFGFNGLGELVYRRTYARFLRDDDDVKEEWYQTVERVVNGTFSMQKEWVLRRGLLWDEAEAQETAQEMYQRMFAMKFLPPGRGLWAMGTKLTTERRLYASLNNCAFVSTMGLAEDPTTPFCFLMDASMLGIGVGFDTKGAGAIEVLRPGSRSDLDDSPTPHLK
ncbi:unnamed protein product, partial [Discosporangium mesarthrocarpum]